MLSKTLPHRTPTLTNQPFSKKPEPYKFKFLNSLSFVRSTRLALKHVRRFIAGFASVPTFALGRIKKFPFAEEHYALGQDRYEVASDNELAAFKLKQNERK